MQMQWKKHGGRLSPTTLQSFSLQMRRARAQSKKSGEMPV
jgi:hypothetical protein